MEIAKNGRENFSIGAFYNITKNQDNPIKTVGRDSFADQRRLRKTLHKQTDRQTGTTKIMVTWP